MADTVWLARHIIKQATFMPRYSTHPDANDYLRKVLQAIVSNCDTSIELDAEIHKQASKMLEDMDKDPLQLLGEQE